MVDCRSGHGAGLFKISDCGFQISKFQIQNYLPMFFAQEIHNMKKMKVAPIKPSDHSFQYGNPQIIRARFAPLSPASGFPVSSRSLRSAQSRKRVPSFFPQPP
jgi:hypothetical protein